MTFSGSSFAVVEPEQGIVFPLVKRKTLNYLNAVGTLILHIHVHAHTEK